MKIYDFLNENGEVDYGSYFNGRLVDFVDNHDEYKEFFEKVLTIDGNICVYKNYELNINFELVSNKKIGYRDVAKVPSGALKIPYILYWQNGESQRAVILNTNSYQEAKGMYYCITEPGNVFEEWRVEMVALYLNENNYDEVVTYINKAFNPANSAGYVQRRADNANNNDVDETKDVCVAIALKMFEKAAEEIPTIEDKKKKAAYIYNVVGRAFLLKKAVYVKYMTNRDLLNDRHGGNSVEQRKFAKSYCDEVQIVPYFELWNGKKKNDAE